MPIFHLSPRHGDPFIQTQLADLILVTERVDPAGLILLERAGVPDGGHVSPSLYTRLQTEGRLHTLGSVRRTTSWNDPPLPQAHAAPRTHHDDEGTELDKDELHALAHQEDALTKRAIDADELPKALHHAAAAIHYWHTLLNRDDAHLPFWNGLLSSIVALGDILAGTRSFSRAHRVNADELALASQMVLLFPSEASALSFARGAHFFGVKLFILSGDVERVGAKLDIFLEQLSSELLPNDHEGMRSCVGELNEITNTCIQAGLAAEADKSSDALLTIARTRTARFGLDLSIQTTLAAALATRTEYLSAVDRVRDALPLVEEELTLWRRACASGLSGASLQLATTLLFRNHLSQLGRAASAEAAARDALHTIRELYRIAGGDAEIAAALAVSLCDLAEITPRLNEAPALCQEALQVVRHLSQEDVTLRSLIELAHRITTLQARTSPRVTRAIVPDRANRRPNPSARTVDGLPTEICEECRRRICIKPLNSDTEVALEVTVDNRSGATHVCTDLDRRRRSPKMVSGGRFEGSRSRH